MRKWMSDRLKRRKKAGDDTAEAGTKKPEPLQPRFYDDEPKDSPAAPTMPSQATSEPESPVVSAPALESEPAAASPGTTSSTEGRPRIQRRRRGRGGRGGSRAKRPATSVAGEDGANPANDNAGQDAAADHDAAEHDSSANATETSAETLQTGATPAQGRSRPSSPAQAAAVRGKSDPSGSATPASTANLAVATRPSKGTVVLAIGLPGSGKSSWFKRHNIHPLSSDLLRELLFDDAQEQRFQDLIFSNLRSMLKARLIARRPMNYVDATNLTPHDRHSWIKLAKDYGYDVQGVFFDVPLDVCMERHQRRGRAVPEDIMRKMAGKLKAPTFEEGFSKITVVRVKQKEKE